VETVRVPAEDRRQLQTDINGRRYTAKGGWFEMPPGAARLHLESAGYGKSWQVAGVPSASAGYRCPDCGFGSFFRTCSRCKAECTKDG